MQFTFSVISRITLEHFKGQTKSKHIKTDLLLHCSPNLKRSLYLDKKELPTKEGLQPMTLALIHGLVGVIHMGHQKGWRDSAEHLRFIIAELEKGFANPADVSEGIF